jgi:hypothetical protein
MKNSKMIMLGVILAILALSLTMAVGLQLDSVLRQNTQRITDMREGYESNIRSLEKVVTLSAQGAEREITVTNIEVEELTSMLVETNESIDLVEIDIAEIYLTILAMATESEEEFMDLNKSLISLTVELEKTKNELILLEGADSITINAIDLVSVEVDRIKGLMKENLKPFKLKKLREGL